MKEVQPEKGLQDSAYTEEEFDSAMEGNHVRQAADEALISEQDAQQITVISLMRIYDMLSAILNHLDSDMNAALLEEHKKGGLAGPLPSLNLE